MPAPKGHPPYPGCETGGRPRKWTKELIEIEAAAFEEWMKQSNSIWYEDFALERGYHSDYLAKWSKENEKFNTVYRRSQMWQKSKLINGGLLNKFNAGFCKFVMGNTCGWSDRQQVSGDNVNPLTFLLHKVDGLSKELIQDDTE